MDTAKEVGGEFYDFCLLNGNALTQQQVDLLPYIDGATRVCLCHTGRPQRP